MLTYVMLIAQLTTFTIIVAEKFGIISYLQTNLKSNILNKMVNCYFCLSFWVAMVYCIVLSIAMNDYTILSVPIFSSPISRFIA